jgi:hypothetical protein
MFSFHYEAWSKSRSKSILCEFENFGKSLYPINEEIVNHFEIH